jgi:hypothetical protein
MNRCAAPTLLLLTLLSTAVLAQLARPTAEELQRTGNGPGPVPGAPPSVATPVLKDIPPPADRRDFSGIWRQARMTPPPGSQRPPGAAPPTPPAAPPAAGGSPPIPGRLPDRVLCLPTAGTTIGVDGPLLITQTPSQITWAAEEMHVIRRIFLRGNFTPDFKPNYLGEAIGHFEGDALVVETRGLKSLPAGAKQLERWTKSSDGRTIEMQIAVVAADGSAIGTPRTQRAVWRPGEEVLEWMCEDYNDEWLPGGADYQDQVNK